MSNLKSVWFEILTTATKKIKWKLKMPVSSLHDFLWHRCFISCFSSAEKETILEKVIVIDILRWLMLLSAWWLICITWKIDCLFIQDDALFYHPNIKYNHKMKILTLPKMESDWFKGSSYTRWSKPKWVAVKDECLIKAKYTSPHLCLLGLSVSYSD